ncbi:MAG: DNA-3-methyladenine glycosylase I [Candidatus Hydrogenedentota bacterium]|nr:MAG: DNA-3-methyladenine glycosylase I [Candidatus Hydrogenedentota bacterium]
MASHKKRCSWAVDDPLMIKYHDEEWGVPLENDNELFERMTLEVFQAGLSWRLILHKRAAFRKSFSSFSIDRVASLTRKDVSRLLKDETIIRNRLKIESTIENAKRLRRIIGEHGSFANYLSSLPDDRKTLYKELKRQFRFMGPKIAESFLLSIGKLDGVHEPDCWKARKARRKPSRRRP